MAKIKAKSGSAKSKGKVAPRKESKSVEYKEMKRMGMKGKKKC